MLTVRLRYPNNVPTGIVKFLLNPGIPCSHKREVLRGLESYINNRTVMTTCHNNFIDLCGIYSNCLPTVKLMRGRFGITVTNLDINTDEVDNVPRGAGWAVIEYNEVDKLITTNHPDAIMFNLKRTTSSM